MLGKTLISLKLLVNLEPLAHDHFSLQLAIWMQWTLIALEHALQPQKITNREDIGGNGINPKAKDREDEEGLP